MTSTPQMLPDGYTDLNEVIAAQQLELQKKQQQIDYLQEMVRLLQKEIFGRKSEVRPVRDEKQLQLFNPPDAPPAPEPQSEVTIDTHTRKKRGRKPLPKELPRVEVIHDISEEEKRCACGSDLERIGEDVSEKLDYIPAKLQVIRHIRYKYACKTCEGVEDDGPTVKIAPPPVQLIPKSIASEGLLAHIVVAKFADALPLYRQQQIFNRLGIELPRTTMADWIIQAGLQCAPLIELLISEIRRGPLINIDETPFQVLNEPGRANTAKSYMWVFCGGALDCPVILYRYHPSRSGQIALDFLSDYQGYIQSDGFSGYEHLARIEGLYRLGCWTHTRRKFIEVINTQKKHRGDKQPPKGLSEKALEYIANIYHIEKMAREKNLSFAEILELRQEKSKPVLEQFKAWLEAKKPLTPPKGLLGKAIQYALNHWDKLVVYIEAGFLKPDNNVAENAIRPFVVGRKNWEFAGGPKGAEAYATFFSLIETAKANGLEPYAYLRYIFEKLPLAKTTQDYRALLPQYIDKDALTCMPR
jgi:transposase